MEANELNGQLARRMIKVVWTTFFLLFAGPSPMRAHDLWADGSPIPDWVSDRCCGIADAHRLTLKQIHRVEGGWRVDGYAHTIPDDAVLPSEDGHVWLFYASYEHGAQSTPFCFFVPQGTI